MCTEGKFWGNGGEVTIGVKGLETIFYKYFLFLPAKKQNRTGRHQNPMSWMQQLVKRHHIEVWYSMSLAVALMNCSVILKFRFPVLCLCYSLKLFSVLSML